MTNKNLWVLAIILFAVVAAIFHFSSPNLADNDSFYYIRLSQLYRDRGIFNANFPWTYYSTMRVYSSSLWYGFAIFLIPFTYAGNLILGIKIAGAILTAAALFIFYWIMKRHRLKWVFLWPFLILFSAPNILYRYLMVRPQLISVGLGVLLFSFLISGGFWSGFLISAGVSWFHLNFAWLPIALLGVYVLARLINKRPVEWLKSAGVIAGTFLGWILRPEAINAAKLFYIQIFQSLLERQGGLPLLFGQEHAPLLFGTLIKNFSLFTILWIAAMAIFFMTYKRQKENGVLALGSFMASVSFFLLTMFVSRRAYDLWIPFGALFIASVFTDSLPKISFNKQKIAGQIAAAVLLIVLAFTAVYSIGRTKISLAESAYQPERLKEVALWLKENSDTGDIVFNLHWSNFSELFFYNQKNYYVGGLDPIFQYSYNPNLYWKYHYLAADLVTKKTCGAVACTREMLEDTYEVLTREFNAKYILLTKLENPAVYYFLENDPRFEKKLDTKKEAVYLIKTR